MKKIPLEIVASPVRALESVGETSSERGGVDAIAVESEDPDETRIGERQYSSPACYLHEMQCLEDDAPSTGSAGP